MSPAAPESGSPVPSSGAAVCPARAEDCRCAEPIGHLFTPHRCGVPGCQAQWLGEFDTQTFRAVTMPTWPLPPPVVRPFLTLVPR